MIPVSQNILTADDDAERKTQAEVLLNAYNRELERRRLAAGAQGLLISGDGVCHFRHSRHSYANLRCRRGRNRR